MPAFVVDCSVATAWYMPDEHQEAVQKLLDQVAEEGALVPSIWHIEIGNALLVGTRRRRISATHRQEAIRRLRNLPIVVDTETLTHAWHATLDLAAQFQLKLYDACYLELAQRRGLPLATLDKELRAAARKLNVALL